MSNNRQIRHVRRERHQHRQEGNQRHDGVDKADAHVFKRGGKTHGVFLHTLCGTFDMTQVLPVRHIMFVHRGTPAENVVANEEVVHHADDHRNQGDAEEDADLMVELIDGHLVWRAQRGLDQIVERRIPGVNRYAHFHQEPGHKDNQRCAKDRPVLPAVG